MATDNAINPDIAMRQAGEIVDFGRVTLAMKKEIEVNRAGAGSCAGNDRAIGSGQLNTEMLP